MSQDPRFAVPLSPEKADLWKITWERKYASHHTAFVKPTGRGVVRRLNFEHPSCQVILDLEKQINGRVLSTPEKG